MPFLPMILIGLCAGASSPAGAVQQLFDAMKTRDAAAVRAIVLPEATLLSVRDGGKPAVVSIDKWLERFGQGKEVWLERMWEPKTLEHGGIAVVWADYDFRIDGKFHHCGVDSVSLVKVEGGWKISSLAFTAETAGCAVERPQ